MKTIKQTALLLSLLLLCACVPTPEQEVVVYKGDDTFEELIRVTAAPQAATDAPIEDTVGGSATAQSETPDRTPAQFDTPIVKPAFSQDFPGHWEDSVETAIMNVRIDADILTNGHPCPVRKVQRHRFDAEEVSRITEAMLPQVSAVRNSCLVSKQEYERALASLTGRGLESRAKLLYEEYSRQPNLPDEEFAPTDHVALGQEAGQTYLCEDGTYAEVRYTSNTLYINRVKNAIAHTQELLRYDGHYGEGPVYVNPPMSQEQAEQVIYRFLEQLGFPGYTVCASEAASYYDLLADLEYSQGWLFWLIKADEYLPIETVRNGLGSGPFVFESDSQYTVPWGQEELIAYVDTSGVSYLNWCNPIDTAEIINEDVELMSFVRIKDRIKQMLRVGLSWSTDTFSYEAVVSNMTLSEMIVPARNEPAYAYLTPTWVLTVDLYDTDLPSAAPSSTYYCYFNAIDGSPISNAPNRD